MPLVSMAQKGKHFEFNYFALEVGVTNSFNSQLGPCQNRYFQSQEGLMHLYPMQGAYYTPGFNAGIQFHHDCQNDVMGLVFGLMLNTWGNTCKYQPTNRKITLTETNRVTALSVPVFIKLGKQIYNDQFYFYFGTQVGYNLKLVTSQKSNTQNGSLKADLYSDGLKKITIPIVAGFNYKIINLRFTVQPSGFLNKDYEFPVGDGNSINLIKPFENQNKVTFVANFGFLIPMSQWTVKRSYFLSRIF